MSESARDAILGRIEAVAGDCDAEYEVLERDYERAGSLTKAQRLELFMARLHEYGAAVFRCSEGEIAAFVRERLRSREAGRIAIAEDFPGGWRPVDFVFVEDRDLTFRQLESCGGALTGCAVAIADTGTIVLDAGFSQGRRALTLLPDYHLCVVFEDQVCETVPEAMVALEEARSRPMTWISGPSATADIEMTRIQGVHGPRSMEVILAAR